MRKYYLKDGRSMAQFCRDSGIPYDTMVYRVTRGGMSVDEAATQPVKTLNNLTVHGKNMAQYCRENKLNYSYLHSLHRLVYPDMDIEEMVDKYVSGALKKKTLKDYCREHGLKYEKIYSIWYKRYIDDYTLKQYIDLVISGVTKTSLEFIPVSEYCRQHGYDYVKIHNLYARAGHRCNTFKDFIKKWEKDNGYSSEAS